MSLNFFSKSPLPEKLPKDMQRVIDALKKSRNKKEYLHKAYTFLTKKYKGDRLKTYLKFFSLFTTDVEKLWYTRGFLHCTHINFILRVFLLKSNFFQEEDIQLRWTYIWHISPHQYIQVRLNKKTWVNIDIWAHTYGIPFGDYSHGFHSRFFKTTQK